MSIKVDKSPAVIGGIFFAYFLCMEELYDLLPLPIGAVLPDKICEIRMRINRPVRIARRDGLVEILNAAHAVTQSDIDYVIGRASGYSLYAVSDTVVKGFLSWRGGIRIGLCGEGVGYGGEIKLLKNVSSLNIRVPTEIKGQAEGIIAKIMEGGTFKNTLIISPPAAGKTTLLREIARNAANCGINVTVIDERYEIAAPYKGAPSLDVGVNSDVIAGIPKITAYETAVRTMSPDVVITDEIYGNGEIAAVLDGVRSGVKIAASVHADNTSALINTEYEKLLDIAEVIITLSRKPQAGTIVAVEGKCIN